MADLFTRDDAQDLLQDKFVLFLGDSNIRYLYLDFVHLVVKNGIAAGDYFRLAEKGELGERVLEIPPDPNAGRAHYETREYKSSRIHLMFHFINRAYCKETIKVLKLIKDGALEMPDIMIMNSCTWDLTRWGPMQEDTYKKNLVVLFAHLKQLLAPTTLAIWTTTLPMAVENVRGGVIIKQLEFIEHTIRFMTLEANFFVHQICQVFKIDLVDLHYHMRFQLHRRASDGIHWEPHAYRHMTCILLTHIACALGKPLPGRVRNKSVHMAVRLAQDFEPLQESELKLPLEILSEIKKVKEKNLLEESEKELLCGRENEKRRPQLEARRKFVAKRSIERGKQGEHRPTSQQQHRITYFQESNDESSLNYGYYSAKSDASHWQHPVGAFDLRHTLMNSHVEVNSDYASGYSKKSHFSVWNHTDFASADYSGSSLPHSYY